MHPSSRLRDSRLAHAALGASILGITTTAVAVADPGTPHAATSSARGAATVPARIKSRHIAYGRDVVLTGREPASMAGQRLGLEFKPGGSRSWRQLSTTTIKRNGHFHLEAPLRRSGAVSVRALSAPATTHAPVATTTTTTPQTATIPGLAKDAPSSAPRRVDVKAAIRVPARRIELQGSRTVAVRGRLLPEVGGRRVLLEGRDGGRWTRLAATRTGRRGGFELRFSPGSSQALRVRFAGDRLNAGTSSTAGSVAIFTAAVASWYYDAGSTACGFHARYGVANRTLPCGTKVTFLYHGRSVNAVVDDRGPFVGGREWDLSQSTAGALGFGGVDTVWSAIG